MSDLYEKDGLRIEWDQLGEGLSGDYDPDDPDDVELLRFSVYLHTSRYTPDAFDDAPDDQGWWSRQDSSYCTYVPVSTGKVERLQLLKSIHAEAGAHDMASLSWITT